MFLLLNRAQEAAKLAATYNVVEPNCFPSKAFKGPCLFLVTVFVIFMTEAYC